jgi:DNA polymerase-3 subunit delta
MKLTYAQLSQHLSGERLGPIYLVAGEEPLLMQEVQDQIRARARALGYAEREVLDVERGFDWSRLREACNAMSLFASLRIVELRMPTGAPGSEGSEMLQALAARPPSDVLLLVICGALDVRARKSAWYTALDDAGVSLYLWPIDAAQFPEWLQGRMVAAGLSPDREAVQLLAERTEGNTLAAAQDIEKLRLLAPSPRIGAEDVRNAVADSSRFDAFDLAERMLTGDAGGSVHSLQRLREEGVEVLELLGALSWNLRQWAQAHATAAQLGDAQRAVEQLRLPRNRQPALLKALRRTRVTQVYGWLRQCARIDQLAKTTHGKEQAWEEMLALVLAASGATGAGRAAPGRTVRRA